MHEYLIWWCCTTSIFSSNILSQTLSLSNNTNFSIALCRKLMLLSVFLFRSFLSWIVVFFVDFCVLLIITTLEKADDKKVISIFNLFVNKICMLIIANHFVSGQVSYSSFFCLFGLVKKKKKHFLSRIIETCTGNHRWSFVSCVSMLKSWPHSLINEHNAFLNMKWKMYFVLLFSNRYISYLWTLLSFSCFFLYTRMYSKYRREKKIHQIHGKILKRSR